MCPKGTQSHRRPPTEQHPTIVGKIYPIQIHTLYTVHVPTMCPKGTQNPPTELHSTIVGKIYPVQITIQLIYGVKSSISILMVSNWCQCQIGAGVKLSLSHSWCQIGTSDKLTLLHSWCQIDSFTLLVSN